MTDQAQAHVSNADETQASWDNIAEGYDRFNTGTHMWLANEGLRRVELQPGERFLDVAAGSGALSIPAARIGADVVATDISPLMLKHLEVRAQSEGLNLETRVMDGHALDFEDGAFDVAGSQFGVMLFPEMPRGIAEMARVIRPGGRVLMTVFGAPEKVEFFGFLVEAIRAVVPDFEGPPMDPPPLPFQLQDPDRLRHELSAAGLSQVQVETTAEKLEFQNGRELWNWLTTSNPIVEDVLAELALTSEHRAMVENKLGEMVQKRSGGAGPAILSSPINIGIGTK